MTLRGRSQGQEDGEREDGRGREAEPAAALPSPPVTLARPDAEPRYGRGHLGPASRSQSPARRAGSAGSGPGHLAGREGGGALSAVLKLAARRGGTEGRGRCAEPGRRAGRAGARGAPRTLSPTLRSPCPAQSRSARTAAERMANPGRRARWAPGRGVVGRAVRNGLPQALERGWGSQSLCASVCRSTHQPPCTEFRHCSSNSRGVLARYRLYTPTPEMTSSDRPAPCSTLWGSGRS